MHGAKGSVKNRIYQFWLICLWKEKRKKRKEKALLKKKNLEEKRKKVIDEVIGNRNTKIWKLSEPPMILKKKEGTVITLSPFGKKPDKVIEVIEKKPKVGIENNIELEKNLKKLEKEVTTITKKIEVEKEVSQNENLEIKKKRLEQELYQIETLQKSYEQIIKKTPKLQNITLVKDETVKKIVRNNIQVLEKAEMICKQELVRVETALKKASKVESEIEKKENTKNNNLKDKHCQNFSARPVISSNKKEKKNSVIVRPIVGGTLTIFPALIQKSYQTKKESTKLEANVNKKKEEISSVKNTSSKNEKSYLKTNSNQENSNHKLKLYRSKMEASKEAEILIKAELERQKNYLRRINEKIEQIDISRRVEYHFRGIHRLLEHILTFTLGVFTIPFSRHRIFGTAVGLTLIGNSIRGIRNSLKLSEEEKIYVIWEDFSKEIYNEKLALKKLEHMALDSLELIKGLKEDIEREFYNKVSSEEYNQMKSKLDAMELKLIEKQKQIKEAEEQLQKTEEKNKVKVKKMKEIKRQS